MPRVPIALAAIVAAAVALSGCADSSKEPAQPSEATVPDDWNLSSSDMKTLYQTFVDDLPQKYGLQDAVTASFVRFVNAEEWATVQVACLTERGYPAAVNPQGGVTFGEIPVEQGPAQSLAAAECEAEYPIDPRYSMKLPKKRAAAQYDFLTETVGPCVEAQGYVISQAPSKATWLDEYYTRGRSWDPFSEAAKQIPVGSSGLDELYQACPPLSSEVYPSLSE